jgi:NTP pyrophosphatase (non-canonical NTP hydrolase)
MQEQIHQVFQKCGNLWSRDKILLKITEELGELVQAFRKGSNESQLHEFGDLLFSLLSLAEREGIDSDVHLDKAIGRFVQYVETNFHPLVASYNQRCTACQKPIHKTNTIGLCAECYSTRRALAGNMNEPSIEIK